MVLLWEDVDRLLRSKERKESFAIGYMAGIDRQLGEEPIFLTLDSLRSIILINCHLNSG